MVMSKTIKYSGADLEGVRGTGGSVDGWGGGVQLNPTFYSIFHFRGKFWIILINLGYCIYTKYSYPLLITLYFSSTTPVYHL